jgi:predicted hydrocarbon binding protein
LLSHAANPGRAAKQAGLECGRALQIAELEDLVRMGWRYHTENDSLVCDSCAFREACRQSEGIACHVHAGLLQVALHRTVKPSSHSEAGCRFLLGHPPTAAN